LQGIDLKAGGRNKKVHRTAPKSDNPYLKLLVKVSKIVQIQAWRRFQRALDTLACTGPLEIAGILWMTEADVEMARKAQWKASASGGQHTRIVLDVSTLSLLQAFSYASNTSYVPRAPIVIRTTLKDRSIASLPTKLPTPNIPPPLSYSHSSSSFPTALPFLSTPHR